MFPKTIKKLCLENERPWSSIVLNQQNHFLFPMHRDIFVRKAANVSGIFTPRDRFQMPMPMPKAKSNTSESPLVLASTIAPVAHEAEFSGQRRLIRPTLPPRASTGRQMASYGHGATLTSRSTQNGSHEDSSHAEVFYFQKQIQSQTRMVVVLENGEQMEGVIEWYDRYAIKMRNMGHSNGDGITSTSRTRVLIYKDCIRYIYKAGENAPQTMS